MIEAEELQELSDSSKAQSEWKERGRKLALDDCERQFAIGDWLIEGEEKWTRNIYKDALAIFNGYAKSTLQTFASVARSVEPLSRNKDLSWAHHKVVARFTVLDFQQQLLAYAAEKRISATKFRKYVDEKHPSRKTKSPTSENPEPKRKLILELPDRLWADVMSLAIALGDEPENTVCHLIERALVELPDIKAKLEETEMAA